MEEMRARGSSSFLMPLAPLPLFLSPSHPLLSLFPFSIHHLLSHRPSPSLEKLMHNTHSSPVFSSFDQQDASWVLAAARPGVRSIGSRRRR